MPSSRGGEKDFTRQISRGRLVGGGKKERRFLGSGKEGKRVKQFPCRIRGEGGEGRERRFLKPGFSLFAEGKGRETGLCRGGKRGIEAQLERGSRGFRCRHRGKKKRGVVDFLNCEKEGKGKNEEVPSDMLGKGSFPGERADLASKQKRGIGNF